MINIGLTTFAENPEPTRSDCHAWSASPDYELLSTVCGINSMAPGFSKIKIEPSLGDLNQIQGSMPHPNGRIVVKLERSAEQIKGEISLPEGVTGIFSWQGKTVPLTSGKQQVQL
jgi:alpha-L-rhamnosidase